jgi:membrane-anchored protein YejM (alkaline phosphatase superfamily)
MVYTTCYTEQGISLHLYACSKTTHLLHKCFWQFHLVIIVVVLCTLIAKPQQLVSLFAWCGCAHSVWILLSSFTRSAITCKGTEWRPLLRKHCVPCCVSWQLLLPPVDIACISSSMYFDASALIPHASDGDGCNSMLKFLIIFAIYNTLGFLMYRIEYKKVQ